LVLTNHTIAYPASYKECGYLLFIAKIQTTTGVSTLLSEISTKTFSDKRNALVTEEDISASVPLWPAYKRDGGEIIVFQANSTHVEKDDFRKEGMEFWMRTWDQTMMLTRGMAGYN
jgi:hypothetical protein